MSVLSAIPLTSRLLSLLYFFGIFGLLYPILNLYTATLPPIQVSSIATKFDQIIPFIPSSIVIYNLSIVLVIAGFFLVETVENLTRYTQRLLLATLTACLCFYFFPLRFSFSLSQDISAYHSLGIDWLPAYQLLHTIDKPFNQMPSLHVAYAVIVAVSLWQPVASLGLQKNLYRLLLIVISGGVAFSTLFTWQHHVLDVIGGLILAMVVIWVQNCLFLCRGITRSKLLIKYSVVAVVGFLLLHTVPFIVFGQELPWLTRQMIHAMAGYWAVSFGLLSLAYWEKRGKLNRWLFAKNPQGKLYAGAWLLQMPIIMLYQGMWQVATRLNLANTASLHGRVTLSDAQKRLSLLAIANPSKQDFQVLQSLMNNHANVIWLDMAGEMSSNYPHVLALIKRQHYPLTIRYQSIPLLDLQPFDRLIGDDILSLIKKISSHTPPDTLVICQCAMGWSRSVAMVGCLLAYLSELSTDEIRQVLNYAYPNNHVNTAYLTEEVLAFLSQQKRDKMRLHYHFNLN